MAKKIVWTHQADADLHQAFLDLLDYSKSIDVARRIIFEIFESTSVLTTNPEIFKVDSLKKNNPGNIRAYEINTFRISYLIQEKAI